MKVICFSLPVTVALLFLVTLPAQAQSALIPHKGIYNVTLERSASSSMIQDISGKMYYSLEYDCMGWSTQHRFKLTYDYADMAPALVNTEFTTYETPQTLNFTSTRQKNGMTYEVVRGQAEKTDDGADITYTMPEKTEITVRNKAPVFPMEHMIKIAEQAADNIPFKTYHLIDGSDVNEGYTISVFVEKPVKTQRTLDGLSSHYNPVRLAFYDAQSKASTPEYEMSFALHKGGIVDKILVDYPDFSIIQRLETLDQTEQDICDNDG